MIQTIADYLDATPATISLGVHLVLGGEMVATTLSRSAWPGCVKQYISTPGNVQVIYVKVKGRRGPHATGATDSTVMVEDRPVSATRSTSSATRLSVAIADPPDTLPRHPRTMLIYVKTLHGKIIPLPFAENLKIEHLKALVATDEGVPSDHQPLIFDGKWIEDGQTLGDYRIGAESTVHLVLRLGKPVIYLYPPNPTRVAVKLSLGLECECPSAESELTTRDLLRNLPDHAHYSRARARACQVGRLCATQWRSRVYADWC